MPEKAKRRSPEAVAIEQNINKRGGFVLNEARFGANTLTMYAVPGFSGTVIVVDYGVTRGGHSAGIQVYVPFASTDPKAIEDALFPSLDSTAVDSSHKKEK
jgi:hypothetical protein